AGGQNMMGYLLGFEPERVSDGRTLDGWTLSRRPHLGAIAIIAYGDGERLNRGVRQIGKLIFSNEALTRRRAINGADIALIERDFAGAAGEILVARRKLGAVDALKAG